MNGQIAKIIKQIERKIRRIMITRQQLDADLGNLFNTLLPALFTAIGNLPQPGNEDFTTEDGQVQAAAQAVQNEINTISPPPPPPKPGS